MKPSRPDRFWTDICKPTRTPERSGFQVRAVRRCRCRTVGFRSLFAPRNSLISEMFSLIVCAGNCAKNRCGGADSCLEIGPRIPAISVFPAKFPVCREFGWRQVRSPLRRQPIDIARQIGLVPALLLNAFAALIELRCALSFVSAPERFWSRSPAGDRLLQAGCRVFAPDACVI